jgi:hypothetical protein
MSQRFRGSLHSSIGLFSVTVVPSANVTILLNGTVLSVNASTAFFFATAPVAIGVQQPTPSVKPVITIRTSSCDSNSTMFSSTLLNASDWLVASSIADSVALQASLRPGQRVRGLFCTPAKHHYAVGVRAGTVLLQFDGLAIFSTAPMPAATAVSLYLVPVSGGNAISRVIALNTSALAQAIDVALSPSVASVEAAVFVIASIVPLAYSFTFSIADCLMGDDQTQTCALSAASARRAIATNYTFTAPIQAGHFTLSVDIGAAHAQGIDHSVRQPGATQRDCSARVRARAVCGTQHVTVLVGHGAERRISRDRTVDRQQHAVAADGGRLWRSSRFCATRDSGADAQSDDLDTADGCNEQQRTEHKKYTAGFRDHQRGDDDDSQTIYIAVGGAVGGVCLIGVLVAMGALVRRRRRAQQQQQQQQPVGGQQQQEPVPMSEFTSARAEADSVPKQEYASSGLVLGKPAGSHYVSYHARVSVLAPVADRGRCDVVVLIGQAENVRTGG